jgi:RNA polymerase subunit RPABC4/transcription elongation factor Spt4
MGFVGTPFKICAECDTFYRFDPECPKCKSKKENSLEGTVEVANWF